MEETRLFWCVNRLMSALANIFVCKRFQTPIDCVGRVRRRMCRPNGCSRKRFSVRGLRHDALVLMARFAGICRDRYIFYLGECHNLYLLSVICQQAARHKTNYCCFIIGKRKIRCKYWGKKRVFHGNQIPKLIVEQEE